MMERILVAMSGGVDSSAAALLLKEAGFQVVGCTMQLWDYSRQPSTSSGRRVGSCCSLDDVYDARRVAQELDVPFYVLNLEEAFEKRVVEPFIAAYLSGRTPSPCILCNTFLKFDRLLAFARQVGVDLVATGHYARVSKSARQGYVLLAGRDQSKDQSYYLFELTQEQLASTRFPVGDYEKGAIRKKAEESRLVTAGKPDSQEICFVPDRNYSGFIRDHAAQINPELGPAVDRADQSGPIVFKDGSHLGQHPGVMHFTVGQRRGLGVAHPRPLYVLKLEPHRNAVIVGYREDLYSRGLWADNINWIPKTAPPKKARLQVKIRSRHQPAEAWVEFGHKTPDSESVRTRILFEESQMAVTPGQAAVFYDGEQVLGGGWIADSIPEPALT